LFSLDTQPWSRWCTWNHYQLRTLDVYSEWRSFIRRVNCWKDRQGHCSFKP